MSYHDTDPVEVDYPPSHTDEKPLLQRLREFLIGQDDMGLRDTLEKLLHGDREKQHGQEALEEDERLLITNVLRMSKLSAKDVMLPRSEIVAIEAGADSDDILQIMAERPHTRLPVYRDQLDDVIGTINIKDVFQQVARGNDIVLSQLTRDVMVVGETMPIIHLLTQMRESRLHMALVVDEYGGIEGLVTINDVVEAIVGDLQDEHDPLHDFELTQRADGSIVADARVPIVDLAQMTDGDLTHYIEDEDIESIGGMIMAIAGDVPDEGEEVISDHLPWPVEVMEADNRRIKRVRIHPDNPTSNGSAPDSELDVANSDNQA
jgi:CBS domain containing-hemolysin-like protein